MTNCTSLFAQDFSFRARLRQSINPTASCCSDSSPVFSPGCFHRPEKDQRMVRDRALHGKATEGRIAKGMGASQGGVFYSSTEETARVRRGEMVVFTLRNRIATGYLIQRMVRFGYVRSTTYIEDFNLHDPGIYCHEAGAIRD